MNEGLENLEKSLGYSFERKETLVKALTHVSKSEVNNEVFEFLGDSVLSLVISKLLVEKFPKNDEGESCDSLGQLGAEVSCSN